MHGNPDTAPTVPNMMPTLGGAVDKAAAAFIEDCERRGLADRVLLLITGEFGRTPGLDKNGGRDHWCKLTPLVFYGGGLKTGQVIGRSDRRAHGPAGDAYTPQHMLATIMHTLFDLGELRVTARPARRSRAAHHRRAADPRAGGLTYRPLSDVGGVDLVLVFA